MRVAMRLKKMGTKNKPHFRIVISAKSSPRDGRYIEEIGHYDPAANPPIIKVNEERARYWLGVGASASQTVLSILKKKGITK